MILCVINVTLRHIVNMLLCQIIDQVANYVDLHQLKSTNYRGVFKLPSQESKHRKIDIK